ncbi:MAG: EAL domain-containing protein [Clostridia bacterium]|nr:EAL domain-containing protein [Clostridia bacterium]
MPHLSGRRRRSIFARLLLPMLLVAAAEMAVLFLTLSMGGAFSTLQNNALDALDERTLNKQQPFQQEMRTGWGNLDGAASAFARAIETQLALRNASISDMCTDTALNASVLEAVAPDLLSRFANLEATGMFLILQGQGASDQKDSFAGIHLRDYEPGTDTAGHRDVLLLRGGPTLSQQLGISLDPLWQSVFTFDKNLNCDYFFKPCRDTLKGGGSQPQDYGSWQGPLRMLQEDSHSVITYSVPMLSSTGEALGVLGVELSQSYLSSLLDMGEFARTVPGCYVLGVLEDDTHVRVAVTSGQMFKQHFRQEQSEMVITEWLDDDSVSFMGPRSGQRVYGTLLDMELYPASALHSGDRWVLIGLQSEESLLRFSHRFTTLMIVGGVGALLVCVFVAILTSRSITRPISRMVHQVRTLSEHSTLHLDPTGMVEIDELGDSIRRLSRDVYESASKLSTILELTGMSVGVFEVKLDSETAYCSSGFFQLMECEEEEHDGDIIPKTRLYQIMREKLTDQVEPDVWRLHSRSGRDRFIRRTQLQHHYDLLGAVMDVTAEIENRRRIEHERDYDILTSLLNRRAFTRTAEELLSRDKSVIGVAAMIMMDLDNLKFVNDTYGHDTGDNYIQSFGKALSAFDELCTCIRGRRSGDEFYILIYGFDSQESCVRTITTAWQRIMQQGIQLPDGQFYRFRCSGGVSWYPSDAQSVATLVHYADFAMYTVKQGSKGVLEYFNRSVYTEDAYLINAREALNHLIDSQLIHFVFQPIVNARTGSIFGYELLMRPDVPELRNPLAVIRLAKAQGLLHHIERLTWYGALEAARSMRQRGLLAPDARIFLNSIANQVLDPDEEDFVRQHYGDLLPNVVLEVTEGEDNNIAYTRRKLSFTRSCGGRIAIDDYGTGYNSEMALMLIDADVVKVDISFVRNVDSDPDKQQLVRNLISYARRKNIMVLGEGVETRSEMETLIAFGMDFMQGYYLGRPLDTPADVTEEVRREIQQAAQKYAEQN